jgi:tetratricopeptide (TPR) repeat protein
MKKYILTLTLGLMWITFANATDPAYVKAIQKQIGGMKTIKSAEESQAVSNGFLRIAEANTSEWLPIYYAALTQTTAAFRFDVNKDQYFDQALELVKKADQIAPGNSEITALHGYILMGKISLDPANRGQSLSPEAMQLFGKAISLDRENPRAVTLMAQMELGMAQFFGQGPEKACGMARMGLELFTKEEVKVDENYLLPTWGKMNAEQVAGACK